MHRQNPLTPLLLVLLAVILLGLTTKVTGIGQETVAVAIRGFFLYGSTFIFFGAIALISWVIYKKTKR